MSMKSCNLSQTDRNKLKSYVGFAMRKRSVVFGTDCILSAKRVGIVITDPELGENSRNKLKNKLSDETAVYELTNTGEIVNNPAVKAFGICDEELTKAIKDTLTKY